MSETNLHLVSFDLCPYVQRAMTLLLEKNANFEVSYIDLAAKPEWFLKLSPLGKVPVLVVGQTVLFESSVICEYIDETQGQILLPTDPLIKAQHRSWMEYSSVLLGLIYSLTVAEDQTEFASKRDDLHHKLSILEMTVNQGRGPYFGGSKFGMVDAFYGPIFRYFQAFAQWGDSSYLAEFPRLQAWESNVMRRESVLGAVPKDYSEKLKNLLKSKNGIYSKKLNLT